jgi:D-alanyl-D-alanine dipeptidase
MKNIIILFVFLFSIELIAQNDTCIIPLRLLDSTIVFDVKYATDNNFTKKVLYPTGNVYIRKVVGDSLVAANKYLLKNFSLKLKVFDAYRPLSVQKIMWEIMPNEDYVANPKKGSRHNRGAAVDVTLVDLAGNELDMGTKYDDFTEKAFTTYEDLPEQILKNRRLLKDTMIKFGFIPFKSEWWHYDFNGWEKFSILDEPIK